MKASESPAWSPNETPVMAAPDTATRHLAAVAEKGQEQGSMQAGETSPGRHEAQALQQAHAITPQPAPYGRTKDDEVIEVPEDFSLQEGMRLTEDLVLGKMIAGGFQGALYTLKDLEGHDTMKVLKALRNPTLQKMKGDLAEFRREWIIGRRLSAIMDYDPDLRAFMGTGPMLQTEQTGTMTAAVLEKLRGSTVDKRLDKDDTFHDIEYIKELLLQVLTALDKAQTLIGFQHHDLRLANIMEHTHGLQDEDHPYQPAKHRDRGLGSRLLRWRRRQHRRVRVLIEAPFAPLLATRELVFKIIDYGHSRVDDRLSAVFAAARAQERASALRAAGQDVPDTHIQVQRPSLEPLPRSGPINLLYPVLFAGKGDAWRLLRCLASRMDGRTWPSSKEADVRAVCGLIHAVTGIRPQAFFCDVGSLLGGDRSSAPTAGMGQTAVMAAAAQTPTASLASQDSGELLAGGMEHAASGLAVAERGLESVLGSSEPGAAPSGNDRAPGAASSADVEAGKQLQKTSKGAATLQDRKTALAAAATAGPGVGQAAAELQQAAPQALAQPWPRRRGGKVFRILRHLYIMIKAHVLPARPGIRPGEALQLLRSKLQEQERMQQARAGRRQ